MSNDYQGELNDRKDDVVELGRRVAVGLGGFAADVGDTAGKIGTKAVAAAKQSMESVQHALSEKDIASDQVRTLVYACMTGSAIADVLKNTGIKVGQKIAVNAIEKIPGKVLTAINQKVGFRFITKFGEKGIINMGKLVPVLGGLYRRRV